jgi:hypothetical protein
MGVSGWFADMRSSGTLQYEFDQSQPVGYAHFLGTIEQTLT